jgi:hypothetical protein
MIDAGYDAKRIIDGAIKLSEERTVFKRKSAEDISIFLKVLGIILLAFSLALTFAKTTAEIFEWHRD